MRLLPKIFPRDDAQRLKQDEHTLLRMEAKIGGELFGPVPKGHSREFFCLDDHTWVWHESWHEKGQLKSITTRYDVRPNGVLKSQNGHPQSYQRLSPEEAQNLYDAALLYRQKVTAKYEHILQTAA